MNKEHAVFSDSDGTLCFHGKIHGIRKMRDLDDGKAVVRSPDSSIDVTAFDVSTSMYDVFVDVRTQEKGSELSDNADIYVVTAARKSSIEKRRDAFNFSHGYIIETGAVIYDSDFNADEGWEDQLAAEKQLIPDMVRMLQNSGLTLDIKGRTASIRIRHEDNEHLSEDEFEGLYRDLQLPSGLKKTKNLEHIDIILASAGKDNAVKYVTENQGYKHTHGIGDDENDKALFEATQYGYLLGSAYPAAHEYASQHDIYVSEGKYFDGINEIFDEIRNRIRGS